MCQVLVQIPVWQTAPWAWRIYLMGIWSQFPVSFHFQITPGRFRGPHGQGWGGDQSMVTFVQRKYSICSSPAPKSSSSQEQKLGWNKDGTVTFRTKCTPHPCPNTRTVPWSKGCYLPSSSETSSTSVMVSGTFNLCFSVMVWGKQQKKKRKPRLGKKQTEDQDGCKVGCRLENLYHLCDKKVGFLTSHSLSHKPSCSF